jgi:hypothetical protein
LAQAATIVGLHGGNILAIDVHRAGGESAVDDLVVEFSDQPDLADLGYDLATNAATTLISHQPTSAVDPVVATMERLAARLAAGYGDPAEALAEGVAELCAFPAVWVSETDTAVRFEAGRLALERQTPVAVRTGDVPAQLADGLPSEVCLLAIPYLGGHADGRVIFMARPVGGDFTDTEIARVEALAALHNEIGRVVGRSASESH